MRTCPFCGSKLWKTIITTVQFECGVIHHADGHFSERTASCRDTQIAELQDVQGNLATMVRRLITKQNPISQKTKDQCWDYLQRKGLQGSVLRDGER